MIEIIPLEQAISQDSMRDFSEKDVFVTSLDLISNLLTRKLPLKDNNKSIKNILEFLQFADRQMNEAKDTLLSLHSDTLISFFSRDTYKNYLDILKECRVMTRVPHDNNTFYTPGKASSLYRFYNEYCFAELAIVIIHSNKQTISIETRVHKKFSNAIKNSKVDYYKAIQAEIEYCKEKNKDRNNLLRSRLSRLFSSHSNRFVKKGTNVNRIFHSFSNLSKVSRQFLEVENMSYNSLDIVNCQPMLLCYYLKQNNLQYDENYIKDCESGIFYEKFVGLEGYFTYKSNSKYYKEYSILDRENVKKQLYKSIFFMFDKCNPINKEFAKLYPITYKTLDEISGVQSMATILQNLEASIFNDLVPKKSKYFFTLFDEIYYTDETDKEELKKKIISKFNLLSLNVKIK
jgi:hypothetical protein